MQGVRRSDGWSPTLSGSATWTRRSCWRQRRKKDSIQNSWPGSSAARKGLSRLEVDIVTGGAFDEIQRSLIRGAVQQTAAAGKVVIVAHAASIALAGDDRVLRVLVTASPEVRAGRLLQTEQLDKHEAAKRIDRSDKERAAYIKRFYGVDRELPSHYDLVVSTDRLSPNDACTLVLDAAAAFDS